ncbi:uncharacterized protein TNCV_1471111 [Trichonephila clavipes]|nr:uncharacterized protein TNCV_1471111 [Trichonephila clavipes]
MQRDLFGRVLGISMTNKVDIEKHFTPSIKDCERLRHNETISTVSIGPNQIRHHNFAGELKNTQFKEAFVKNFIDHWANENMYPFIGNKTIYLSLDKCYSYRIVNNQVIRSIEESLCDEHEADTRIIYHICQISVDAQVVVRCSDSDIDYISWQFGSSECIFEALDPMGCRKP